MADNQFDPLNPLGNPNQVIDLGYGPYFFPNSGSRPFFGKNRNYPALDFTTTIQKIAANALPSGTASDLSSNEKLVDFLQDWINGNNSRKPVEGKVAQRKKDPEFIGYFRGYPVYIGKGATENLQGYTKDTNDIMIALNPLMTAPVGDVLRHESGHAMVGQGFPETDEARARYTNVMKTLNEKQKLLEASKPEALTQAYQEYLDAYRNYQTTEQEQAANWIGGLFGSWANEPAENPAVVNMVFDYLYGLSRLNEAIENMFKVPGPAPAKVGGQVP